MVQDHVCLDEVFLKTNYSPPFKYTGLWTIALWCLG